MPKCIKLKRKHRQVCIGDMDEIIAIQTRTADNSFGAEESFTFNTTFSPFSMVETLKDVFIVDDVTGGDIQVTHGFTIRVPDDDVSGEFWVLFKDKRYRILGQEDLDERGEFLKLLCAVRGSDTKAAADA